MVTILLQMNPNIQSAILFIALLGIVWAFFLLTHRRGNRAANKYLAILISVLAIFILRRTADPDRGSFYLFLYFISHGSVYFIGPSIYFHIRHVTGQLSKHVWKHFMPAALTIILMALLFYYRSAIDEMEDYSTLKTASILFISLQVIHLLMYLFYSGKLVIRFSKKAETYYSTMSRINLNWVRRLLIVSGILGAGVLSLHILIVSGGYYNINNTADSLFLILLAFIILSIIYKSWKQPEIISGIYEEDNKYKTSPLSDTELSQLKEQLDKALSEEKIFLIQELNLDQLADHIGTRSYLLSQLLNEHYGENFFNFINGHRIDFSVQRIEEGDLNRLTLEAIAYESGFNSKSTFNRAFKKKMGCSPNEYRRSLMKAS